ncbi:MAG: HU family DNA-binding protein [Rhodothermales bacterium]
MDSISTDDVTTALIQVLHDALIEGKSVRVPGLGTFLVRHEASRVHPPADGSVRIEPPQDTVELIPNA